MRTFYVKYLKVVDGMVLPWIPSPLVRVTRNRLGREVREWVATGKPAPRPPCVYGEVECYAEFLKGQPSTL